MNLGDIRISNKYQFQQDEKKTKKDSSSSDGSASPLAEVSWPRPSASRHVTSLEAKRRRQQRRESELRMKMKVNLSEDKILVVHEDGDEEADSTRGSSGGNTPPSTSTTSISLDSSDGGLKTPARSISSSGSKDVVSMLIIDGCRECESRLKTPGLDSSSSTLGDRNGSSSYIYSGGERRKSQCDPNNWTYGSPQPFSSLVNRPSPPLNMPKSDSRPGIVITDTDGEAKVHLSIPDESKAMPKTQDDMRNDPRHVLPQYLENIIHHHAHMAVDTKKDSKFIKKMSKAIVLPEDPSDPGAFTVTPGLTRPPKAPWCSSEPVLKIVGSFAVLMSLAIIAAIVYMKWFSDTMRPM